MYERHPGFSFIADSALLVKYTPSWLPGAGFKRRAEKWKKVMADVVGVPAQHAQANVVRLRVF